MMSPHPVLYSTGAIGVVLVAIVWVPRWLGWL